MFFIFLYNAPFVPFLYPYTLKLLRATKVVCKHRSIKDSENLESFQIILKLKTSNMSEFAGKVVIVTGSSVGIGAAIAEEFAKQGAKVTVCGRNSQDLQKVADNVKNLSKHEALQIIGDISDEAIQKRIIDETIAKFGKLDVLVNNAGIVNKADNILHPEVLEAYDKIHNVNVRAPLALTHLAAEHLEKTKGNIVNISSGAAIIPVSFKNKHFCFNF